MAEKISPCCVKTRQVIGQAQSLIGEKGYVQRFPQKKRNLICNPVQGLIIYQFIDTIYLLMIYDGKSLFFSYLIF